MRTTQGKLTVVWHRCFRQKNVALARHSSCHRMDGKSHIYALGSEHLRDLRECVLCLGHRHAITNNLEYEVRSRSTNVLDEHTMMTLSAFASASTVSSTVVVVTEPSIFFCSCTLPMPPKRTFIRDRFIATHCLCQFAPNTSTANVTDHYVRQDGAADAN